MNEIIIQRDIALALNSQYPDWNAWKCTTHDNVKYVEFEKDGERFIITIQKAFKGSAPVASPPSTERSEGENETRSLTSSIPVIEYIDIRAWMAGANK